MAEKEPCVIGSKITISGQISGAQDLVVEGRLQGRVGLQSRLIIEESGVVEAEVDVTEAQVRGEVRGDLSASKTATLFASARVTGNIRAPKIIIEDGAHFSGAIEMDVDLPADVKSAQ